MTQYFYNPETGKCNYREYGDDADRLVITNFRFDKLKETEDEKLAIENDYGIDDSSTARIIRG
jgi:hypothetical protein